MTALLHPNDQAFLDAAGYDYDVQVEAGFVCVVIKEYPLAAGLTPAASDLLVRLPAGFPDTSPDMFWFSDKVVRADGRAIAATEHTETYLQRLWHRWSRHIRQHWQSGVDNLQSYMAYIRKCLSEAAK